MSNKKRHLTFGGYIHFQYLMLSIPQPPASCPVSVSGDAAIAAVLI